MTHMGIITNHDRLIAREVITKAANNRTDGFGPADRLDFDTVLRERFPIRDKGGVSMANGRARGRILAAIAEFYMPSETEA
jgi:hypothetical protein